MYNCNCRTSFISTYRYSFRIIHDLFTIVLKNLYLFYCKINSMIHVCNIKLAILDAPLTVKIKYNPAKNHNFYLSPMIDRNMFIIFVVPSGHTENPLLYSCSGNKTTNTQLYIYLSVYIFFGVFFYEHLSRGL